MPPVPIKINKQSDWLSILSLSSWGRGGFKIFLVFHINWLITTFFYPFSNYVSPKAWSNEFILQTNGISNGLLPMLRVYNNTARYVDQGGNKRPGAFALYLEPWHADIFEFLDCRKNTGLSQCFISLGKLSKSVNNRIKSGLQAFFF